MIGVVCFWDRYATPYLEKYERIIKECGIPYEVIFWERNPKENADLIIQEGNYLTINYLCKNGKEKYLSFFRWRFIVRKILKQRKYSSIIILSTMPGILLSDILRRNYREKYLFDIRDYTKEENPFFKRWVMKLVNNSKLTAISSKGFLRWLNPSEKIMVNHNITVNSSSNEKPPHFLHKSPLNFGFVGNVRLDRQTRALLVALSGNPNIEQHYYGRILSSCNIEYLKEKYHIDNLYLHGSFDVKEKEQIYSEIDLINTVFANAENEEDIALGDSTPLPNRLYDALVFYRPLVASKGTYMAELVEQYNIGICVNGFDPEAPQKILNYAKSFNTNDFIKGCQKLRAIVVQEETEFIQKVKQIINNW